MTQVRRKANCEERKGLEQPPMPAERLQKIIAAAGIASRRKAEELITSGLVSVNGQTVTALGTKADPEIDRIKVNGKPLRGPERHVYVLLHKPKGYVTTVTDPEGRPTVLDLVRGVGARVSCRTARLPKRRIAAADQRRRAGAEVDARLVARAEDVSGKDQWQGFG